MKKSKFLILSFFSLVTFADADQNLSGQLNKSPYEGDAYETSPLINVKDYLGKKPSTKNKPNSDWTKKYSGNTHLFNKNKSGYLKVDSKKITRSYYKKADYSLGFRYFKDDYDFTTSENVYNRLFESGSENDSVKGGLLQISYRRFGYRGWVDLIYGLDAGASLSQGKLLFDDGEVSRATVSVWTVPVDFVVGLKLNLGRYIGITAVGGPSVAALLQNRSDKKGALKNRRQIGYGYAASGSLDFSLSQIFPSMGFDLASKSDISDLTFSLFARTTSLSNFKDKNVTIEGASFGAGFVFELL